MSLGDVKHIGRAEREAFSDVCQRGVRSLIRKVSIRCNATDSTRRGGRSGETIHLACLRPRVAVAARQLLITAGDRTDPEFSRQQVVNQVRVIKCGLPGGVAMLQRNDGFVGWFRRKEHLTWRDRRADAERDTLTQQTEKIHVGITANDGKAMPQVKAERLARIHGQELFPDVIRPDVKKSTQVRLSTSCSMTDWSPVSQGRRVIRCQERLGRLSWRLRLVGPDQSGLRRVFGRRSKGTEDGLGHQIVQAGQINWSQGGQGRKNAVVGQLEQSSQSLGGLLAGRCSGQGLPGTDSLGGLVNAGGIAPDGLVVLHGARTGAGTAHRAEER